jgi:hypothetical protein
MLLRLILLKKVMKKKTKRRNCQISVRSSTHCYCPSHFIFSVSEVAVEINEETQVDSSAKREYKSLAILSRIIRHGSVSKHYHHADHQQYVYIEHISSYIYN